MAICLDSPYMSAILIFALNARQMHDLAYYKRSSYVNYAQYSVYGYRKERVDRRHMFCNEPYFQLVMSCSLLILRTSH